MPEKGGFYNLRNRNVKRMLWPVDHEQTKQYFVREQQKIKKELTEKYNFDFESGKPLKGRYNWRPVGSESPVGSPIMLESGNPCTSSSCSSITVEKNEKTLQQKRPSHNSDKKRKRDQSVSTKKVTKRSKKQKTDLSVVSSSPKSKVNSRVLRKR